MNSRLTHTVRRNPDLEVACPLTSPTLCSRPKNCPTCPTVRTPAPAPPVVCSPRSPNRVPSSARRSSWARTSSRSRWAPTASRRRRRTSASPTPRGAPTPAYRRVGQGYTAWAAALTRLVDEYEAAGADWRDVERARFALNALTSALAPTNTLPGNPAALKKAFDTGGRSLVRGRRATWSTTSGTTAGCRTQTDRTAFAVGRNLGVTQGRGRLPGRRHRADPVHADDAAGARAPAGHRAAADRPVLLPRPAAGAQLRRVRGRARGCRSS